VSNLEGEVDQVLNLIGGKNWEKKEKKQNSTFRGDYRGKADAKRTGVMTKGP